MITNDNKISNRQVKVKYQVYNKRLVKTNKAITQKSKRLVKSESGSMMVLIMLLFGLLLIALLLSQSTGSGILDGLFQFLKSILG